MLRVLQAACDLYWWYREPHVEGQPFDRLSFSFTVLARDQWRAHARAMKLAVDCYYAMGMRERDVPPPDWEALAPHTNRGHDRVTVAPGASGQDPD